ncbi:MAG: hypothetical protein MZV63_14320 [Marinilabiliales bacterium]|nr:hypothetical protein [Marinilabiliales bacterium]
MPSFDEALGLEPRAPGVAVVHHGRDEAVAGSVERFERPSSSRTGRTWSWPFVREGPRPLEEARPDLADGVGRGDALLDEGHDPGDGGPAGLEGERVAALDDLDPGLGREARTVRRQTAARQTIDRCRSLGCGHVPGYTRGLSK